MDQYESDFDYFIASTRALNEISCRYDKILCIGCSEVIFRKNYRYVPSLVVCELSLSTICDSLFCAFDFIYVYDARFIFDLEEFKAKVTVPYMIAGGENVKILVEENKIKFHHRVFHQIGKIVYDRNGNYKVKSIISESGYLLFGPYVELPQGEYRVKFKLSDYPNMLALPDGQVICKISCEISPDTVLSELLIKSDDLQYIDIFYLKFTIEQPCVMEFKVFSYGIVSLSVYPVLVTKVIDLNKVNFQVVAVPSPLPAKEQLAEESCKVFNNTEIFHIYSVLYNTPEPFLTTMLDSVLVQSYGNWKLHLYDTSDEFHAYVKHICTHYSEADVRISYEKMNEMNSIKFIEKDGFSSLIGDRDILHPSLLFEVMNELENNIYSSLYTDEVVFEADIRYPDQICNKPHFSIDTLRSSNFVGNFFAFRSDLVDSATCQYDIVLQTVDKSNNILHIQKQLYFRRKHDHNEFGNEISALRTHLERMRLKGKVSHSAVNGAFKIEYEIPGNPKVSIIILNKNHKADLQKCVESILNKSSYKNFEIIIVENNSDENDVFDYYKSFDNMTNIKVLEFNELFNYSKANNFASSHATGEYLVFLNNDTEIITASWIEEMLMFAQRMDVGAVGAKLYYEDGQVQHAGMALNIDGHIIGHIHRYAGKTEQGYMGRLLLPHTVSAVTGACLMVSASKFVAAGGFNEKLPLSFNDVDLCFRLRKHNMYVIFTPYAELYHFESKTRNSEEIVNESCETKLFCDTWRSDLDMPDLYYNGIKGKWNL